MRYIQVALDVPLPQLFDYACPEAEPEHVGLRVCVPFGAKQTVGVIMAVTDQPTYDAAKIRPARELLRDVPPLPPDVLQMLRFCSEYYHHPIGEVVLAALPGRYRTAASSTRKPAMGAAITAKGRAELEAGGGKRSAASTAMLSILGRGVLDELGMRELTPSQRRILRRLVERGLAQSVEAAACGPPCADSSAAFPLTAEQSAAAQQIAAAGPGFRTWLLHGVTGSGKTEVYLAVMAKTLAASRQVLFLVPEIGLTPQLLSRLGARFREHRMVALHSGLAGAERARNWSAAQRGEARIVLGTRSSVFAPLPYLGLIVVDEEHDGSYKQTESVRYSARDLAIWRARQRDVPIILGSATPSLESYYASTQGRYALAALTRRPSGVASPSVRMVAAGDGGRNGLTETVLTAIAEHMARNEQVLIFINRRGYAPVLVCPACAWAPSCPRCAAHMVLHKARPKMLCHHCGHEHPVPRHCAGCGNSDLQPRGFGTQRVESSLRATFPEARLLRVDRDTTRGRTAWPAMRTAISEREVDLLVGTQLLSKGHDFPGLSLVCVLNADASLYSTDFRAAEHLFAQLLQVSGRAGRGTLPGTVLIQTSFPEHPLYRAVCAQDYTAFARSLIEERRAASLSPFVYHALLRAEAPRLQSALDFLHDAVRLGQDHADGVEIYDPTPAVMARLQGRERAQLLVQASSRAALHRFLDRWCEELWSVRAGRARWALDVDPLDI